MDKYKRLAGDKYLHSYTNGADKCERSARPNVDFPTAVRLR
jgi:hypothetical protein